MNGEAPTTFSSGLGSLAAEKCVGAASGVALSASLIWGMEGFPVLSVLFISQGWLRWSALKVRGSASAGMVWTWFFRPELGGACKFFSGLPGSGLITSGSGRTSNHAVGLGSFPCGSVARACLPLKLDAPLQSLSESKFLSFKKICTNATDASRITTPD
jgi:hypothetical protein